jgi:PIN domain nuclease of toxin-antitoxin system
MTVVLDASAVLALLNGEPGAAMVKEQLPDAVISVVNLVEVGTKLIDNGMSFEAAQEAIELLELAIEEFDLSLAELAIQLRPATKGVGLSLADRACLALAVRLEAVAMTADKVWASVNVGCQIELIR